MTGKIKTVLISSCILCFLVLAGCGGGSGSSSSSTSVDAKLITSVGWYLESSAPDYSNNGITCRMRVAIYYSEAVAATNIDSFTVKAPTGGHWVSKSVDSELGVSSSGRPYIARWLIYTPNTQQFPLGGTWSFQLNLKDGTTSTFERTLHDPGTSAAATHDWVYTQGASAPTTDSSAYVMALRIFPSDGYSVQYFSANGGRIATTGLSTVMARYLHDEPRAYNMYCWLYDGNKNYLGMTIRERSPVDHSSTGLVRSDGEALILPQSTVAASGTVDLAQVRFVRFVWLDGAQFEPSSYSTYDYRSISSLVPVVDGGPTVSLAGSIQGHSLSITGQVTTLAGAGPLASGGADGSGATARFDAPNGIATDGVSLYVADNVNGTIRKISLSTGAVTTIAGLAGAYGSADGTGTAARFYDPLGITVVGANLYVSDSNNHTIRKVEISSGLVTTFAGTAGSMGAFDGVGSAAKFNGPSAITTDGVNLYVADTFNNTIRKIDIATRAVTTLAGVAMLPGSTDGVGTSARFSWPSGVTTDGTSLYVADRGNATIRIIDLATGAVTTMAGVAGRRDFADGIGTAASFRNPMGIATDGTRLYITDYVDNVIRRIDIATRAVTTIAGTQGTQGFADGFGSAARFYWPTDITTDGIRLYVVDSENNAIRKID